MSGGTGSKGRRGGTGGKDGAGAAGGGLDAPTVEAMIAAAVASKLDAAAVSALIASSAAPKPFVANSTPIPSQGWNRMVFSGLDGDLHKRYRLTAQFKITGTSGLQLQINEKTNMTTWWYKVVTSTTAVAFSAGSSFTEIGKAGVIVSLTAEILAARFNTTNRSGRVFHGTMTVQQSDGVATLHRYEFFGPFMFPAENITRVDIVSSDGFDTDAVGRIEQVFT